jgi:YegS/Rv2252/BmrU family lipid kinase
MTAKRVGFIVNPAAGAGRGQDRWAEFHAGFRQSSIEEKVLFTSRSGEGVSLAKQLARDCEIVVAVGGDGTVFDVASGLLLSGATGTHFGIVPAGTGNDAARQCGIRDFAQARKALQGAHTTTLDVIRIHCRAQETPVTRFALLYGSVGIVGEVLKQTTTRVKRIFGPRLAYHVGALRAILTCRAPAMRLTCDGQTQEKSFLMVCASNSEVAGGGMRLAPGALMDDGLLNLNVCEPIGRCGTVALLWRIFRGRHLSHPKLRYFPARAVAIEASPAIEVEADGELIGHTPAQFEVVPGALEVLIP